MAEKTLEDLMSEDDDDGDEAFDETQAPIAEPEPMVAELDTEPAPTSLVTMLVEVYRLATPAGR